MTTMYSLGAMLAMMAFLVLAVVGPLLAFRVLGEHEVKGDHPASERFGQHEATTAHRSAVVSTTTTSSSGSSGSSSI